LSWCKLFTGARARIWTWRAPGRQPSTRMPIPADSNGRSYRPRPIMRMHMRQTRGRSSSRITGMPIAILKAYISPTCPYTARKLSSLIT